MTNWKELLQKDAEARARDSLEGPYRQPQNRFLAGASIPNARLLKLIEALSSVRNFSLIYEYPEHEIRHALAVELPHEIDQALESLKKELEGK